MAAEEQVALWTRALGSIAGAATAVADVVKAVASHLTAPITFQEVLLLGGSGLLGFGLYPIYAPLALIAPGVVLIYVAIAGVK